MRIRTVGVVAGLIVAFAVMASTIGAATAQPAEVRYTASAAADLYTAANYLGQAPEVFVDTSLNVHAFLLRISGKTAVGGGCAEHESVGLTGEYTFVVTRSDPLKAVMDYYCFSAVQATFASTSLLTFLTALDAKGRGVKRIPITPPTPTPVPDNSYSWGDVATTACGRLNLMESVSVTREGTTRFKRISVLPGPDGDLGPNHTYAQVVAVSAKMRDDLLACLAAWSIPVDATERQSIYDQIECHVYVSRYTDAWAPDYGLDSNRNPQPFPDYLTTECLNNHTTRVDG